MWKQDRGLVAHGVRAMRNDNATQCEERVGDRRYLKFKSITRPLFSTSSRRKISGENTGSSWCPRSLSIKLSEKKM